MKALEQRILKDGQVLPGGVLKVGSFLNQKIDTAFLFEMGKEIARLYENEKVTKIVTIEASGIALAVAAAHDLNVPVVFAKKSRTSNVSGGVYQAKIYSFTHQCENVALIPRDYLDENDRVLIVDDFLAEGNAIAGLIQIVRQAGASLVGAAAAVEKGFQGGGDALRAQGVRVESLAIIDQMDDDKIIYR